jgi:hypothetical protein
MADLPVKYVKDKDGKFLPVTSFNAVLNEEGKNVDDVFAKKDQLGTQAIYELDGTHLTITIKE